MKPYKNSSSKKDQIESMFDDISERYDKLNQILTFGLHKRWRKRAINLIDNNIEKINNSSMELEKLVKLYNDSVEIINTIENSLSHLKIEIKKYDN